MSSIDGLTEEQCQALAGVQVGDLLLVESFPKHNEYENEDGETSQNDDAVTSGDEAESSVVTNQPESENGSGEVANDDLGIDEEGNDDAGEEVEDEEAEESTDEDVQSGVAATVFKVIDLTKNDDGSITDITLCALTYCAKPGEAASPVYHLYGGDVVDNTISGQQSNEGYMFKVTNVVNDSKTTGYSITLKPTGHDMFATVFNNRCPARCSNGWVATQEEMHAMVADHITTVSPHTPVCPVCIGKGLMQEYQSLRETLESYHMVEMVDAIEFYSRLNPRRRQLGYSFHQFDEREWGYMFDDMQSEDDYDEGEAHDHGRWGYWDEAMDPSSGATFHPAQAAAIAALPRKLFADVEKKEDSSTTCAVCIEIFTDDMVVAELPCGHVFCDSGCAEQWLKQSNSCPTCRKKLPAKEEGEQGEHDSGFEESSSNPNDMEKDGEDVVMSDAPVSIVA